MAAWPLPSWGLQEWGGINASTKMMAVFAERKTVTVFFSCNILPPPPGPQRVAGANLAAREPRMARGLNQPLCHHQTES